jgi:galactokinase
VTAPASAELRRAFADRMGRPPELLVRSPGRVNVIGDHTDYNDGWVLPAAIDLGTDVAGAQRSDGMLRVVSEPLGAADTVPLDRLDPRAGPPWTRYVRGYAALLQEAGVDVVGADLLVGGDLPIGAGLSSSASLGLGVAVALLGLAGAEVEPTELARLGQRVENEVVGVASGIMDQLAVACGRSGHALLLDCRTAAVEPVPLPPSLRLLVLDSGVPRRLAESGYNQRRAECDRALAALQQLQPGLRALRDVTPDLLAAVALDEVARRRARHVVTENQRVLAAADALRRGAGDELGALMAASHASLRDDYEVSVAELDALVALASQTDGVLGARLTGAGFGGCAVALVATGLADVAAALIVGRYRAATGLAGSASVCAPADGVHLVDG